MAVVPWVSNFPVGWQQSRNAGASYDPPDAPTTSNEVIGPTGSQRFRTQFTIPANVSGTYFCTVSGDIYDGSVNVNAHLYLDGVDQGSVTPLPGPRTFTLPAVPGAHTIELWIGQSDGPEGTSLTVPAVSFDFANVVNTAGVPCDCCPTDMRPVPSLSQVRFSTVAETASQAGWTPTQLPATIDGITTSTLVSGYTSPGGGAASTTVNVTYTTATPYTRVRGLRLWNQTGGDLTDSDGLGTFTADFYLGAVLVWTATFSGVNGGAAQDLLFPASGEVASVDRVVLRSLGKLSGSTVAPTWRELQLLVIRDAYPCRRSSGVIEWYDIDGNRATPVAASASFTTTSFTMSGFFFGDGPDSAGENICSVDPAPSSTTGFSAPVSGCYDPVVGTPSMTWTGVSTVELQYGNPPHTSGGVDMAFSSPDLGSVTWPASPYLNPGQQITSNVLTGGRTVRLTYLSGPLGATSNSVRAAGGPQLEFHFASTDSTTPPVRIRLDILN